MPHAVFFYQDETALIDTLVRYILAAYQEHATAIVIATEPHRRQLQARFQSLDQVVGATVMYINAVNLLSAFMVNGQPDQTRFVSALTHSCNGPRSETRFASSVKWCRCCGGRATPGRPSPGGAVDGANSPLFDLAGLWVSLSGFPDQQHDAFQQVCHSHTRVLFDLAPLKGYEGLMTGIPRRFTRVKTKKADEQ